MLQQLLLVRARQPAAPGAALLRLARFGDRRHLRAAGQLVHDVQASERVGAVVDRARSVGAAQVVLDVGAVQRRTAADDRRGDAALAHQFEVHLHHVGRLDQQTAHADRVGALGARRLEDPLDRHLDAEVDDAVAVVADDDVDEVLADVVHVAAHGGDHERALLLALDALHELLQVVDRGLHRLGTLQHERQLHLAAAEQVADDLHAVEQDLVDDLQRPVALQRLVEVLLDADLVAVDDAPLQPLLDRQLHLVLALAEVDALAAGEALDEREQRVVARAPTVPDQVERDLAVLLVELVDRHDLAGVHDRGVETVPDRFGEVHRVQDLPRVRVEAEADVRQAEDGADAGDVLLDELDAAQRLHAGVARRLVARPDREGQRVEDQVAGAQAVAVHDDVVDAPGDRELALRGLGHALLVDRQRDEHRAVAARQLAQPVGLLLAVLEVDRVDDRAAGHDLERLLDDVELRAVDHHRRRDLLHQRAQQAGHVCDLVTADVGRADVEHVRALVR